MKIPLRLYPPSRFMPLLLVLSVALHTGGSLIRGHYCGWGQGSQAKPRVLNAPHVASSSQAWRSANKTEPAGLSAWQPQRRAEERPFLGTLSIGVLILWIKSEFGVG